MWADQIKFCDHLILLVEASGIELSARAGYYAFYFRDGKIGRLDNSPLATPENQIQGAGLSDEQRQRMIDVVTAYEQVGGYQRGSNLASEFWKYAPKRNLAIYTKHIWRHPDAFGRAEKDATTAFYESWRAECATEWQSAWDLASFDLELMTYEVQA